jgi:hypothetical protein
LIAQLDRLIRQSSTAARCILRVDGTGGVSDEVILAGFGRREPQPTTRCRQFTPQPASAPFLRNRHRASSQQTQNANDDTQLSVWVHRLSRIRNHEPRLTRIVDQSRRPAGAECAGGKQLRADMFL